MPKIDWNPELYLKYGKERIQPSIDLVSRIDYENPSKIVDIGCGPGNSTQILAERWPDAMITGIDNSPSMIEKAKIDFPNQRWLLMDAGTEKLNEKFDIVFSNAAIQWIPDHTRLLDYFSKLLTTNGMLAVQIPLFFDMQVGKSISMIAQKDKWKSQTKGVDELFTIHNHVYYYDRLIKLFSAVDLWTTNYMHIMKSHLAILEMIRSTGLKPYLERLNSEQDKQEFESEVLKEIIKEYPVQLNGKVLFPFKRLFFIARL